ncbi:MAG: aspartate:alanine exchanger family transporter [Mycobacterium leprae]
MIEILRANPLLLLFVVLGVGYPLGRLRFGGASLGVAAVLFVGLIVGGLDPSLKLPEIIYQIGLALFVYTVGLSSGAGFFASLKGKGLRDNLFIIIMILLAAGLTLAVHFGLKVEPAESAGLFAGSLTNTPALAAVVEYLKLARVEASQTLLSQPVVAYSLAYPVSVLVFIATSYVAQRIWRVDYKAEATTLNLPGSGIEPVHSQTLLVTNADVAVLTVPQLIRAHQWDVLFGRVRRGDQSEVVTPDTRLCPGDLVTVVGTEAQLARVAEFLGQVSRVEADLDRSEIDYRRAFVSNRAVVGRQLRELRLPERYGAIITRVRRGDIELIPHGDTVLELGDRVRVLSRRENLDSVFRVLGDSYRAISEIDILSFSLGLALGLLLGLLPISVGGVTFKLGIAGGPLIVALVLGNLTRTGPIVWCLPYSANLMLRQLGLVLFLAGIGTRAGYDFFATLSQSSGLALLGGAALIALVVAVATLWIGYRLLRIPFGLLTGMLAALQTQPATLGFALEQADNELPNIGYTTVYPAAMVVKILVAQLLLTFLL